MKCALLIAMLALAASAAFAGVGDPQTKTDHPWYPGELSCSTFPRLFKTQADLYQRVTGRKADTDEDKALASWFWRNINYFHCTVGREDVWDKGLAKGEPAREYWSGLFGYGFGLCYTTHHQWHGETERLLGPCRGRTVGVAGHTSFEVYLTGGEYGQGKWALLDHDISTVVFTEDGKRLMGLMEISKDMSSVKKSNLTRGWRPGGLHPSDPNTYKRVDYVGYATGYAGVPPMVYLRAGETLRRYLKPGLAGGKTFAYWGINYSAQRGRFGPTRSRTWVNQPEKMYQAKRDCGHRAGQGRFANAVYTYTPDFASGAYKDGVIDEGKDHVTFEWYSPYVVAATPAPAFVNEQYGIHKPGCTNGLVLRGQMTCPVEISTDQGTTWRKAGNARDGLDVTDMVKGHRQYWIRFGAGAGKLVGTHLTMRTLCQCGPCVIPRLEDGLNKVTFEASGRAFISAGPNVDQASAHLVAGKMNSPTVTLELAAPRKAKAVGVYAAARVACGAPPRKSSYNIDYSADGGKTWKPVLKDWQVIQRPPEPKDWWSQTFLMSEAPLDGIVAPVRVRFTNTGRRTFMRAEAHLVYEVPSTSPLKVTFAWKEAGAAGLKTAGRTYRPAAGKPDTSWTIRTGKNVETVWVEYAAE